MTRITIRPARPEDAGTIHSMLVELSEAMSRGGDYRASEEEIRRYGFGDRAFFETLLAEIESEPVGLVIYFYEYSTWNGVPGVYIQDLYVSSVFRGSGVGRRLLQSVANAASKREAVYMRLSVYADNDTAAEFYGKLGFMASKDEVLLKLSGREYESLLDE
jgi:GNAT superfamily N-acetyltransferase